MTADLVARDPRAHRAWPWLPLLVVPGRIYCGPTGETLTARADGGFDVLQQGGRPHGGIGADPCPPRRP